MTVIGKRTRLPELPLCDFCQEIARAQEIKGFRPQQARYDARLLRRTAWAYMCPRHFNLHGAGLGTGLGQVLLTTNEVGCEREDCPLWSVVSEAEHEQGLPHLCLRHWGEYIEELEPQVDD
jgi:hypothetical protein